MKKLRNIFLFVLSFSIITGLLCTIAYAHSGKTDEYGGHYDNSTGEYHYHHGYPAHQHTNGICPYDFDDKTDKSPNKSHSYVSTKKTSINAWALALGVISTISDLGFAIYKSYDNGFKLSEFLDYIKMFATGYPIVFAIAVIVYFIYRFPFWICFFVPMYITAFPIILSLIFTLLIMMIFEISDIITKLKNKYKNKKIVDNDKEKYIAKGWSDENLNIYNATSAVKRTNTNNDIDIFNYIDNENRIINITAFIADLINKYFNNSDCDSNFHNRVFIREILYFSQLSVLNSFKKIYHLDIRKSEFLSASRYLVGITMSVPQPDLLFNEPEKVNIETINKNNQFNKDDIDTLCKILFVAYHKGYAPLDYMLSLFDQVISETDMKDYYKFKNTCEDYIYKLASQLTLLRQHEIKRTEKHKLNRDDTDYDNCKYSLKETPTFYIM